MAEPLTAPRPLLKPHSWLFRFNVIAAALALLAVAVAWVMIFREPPRTPATPPVATTPADTAPAASPPVQTAQDPPTPVPAPDATPGAEPEPAASLQPAPLPLPRPALPAVDGSTGPSPDGSAFPLQLPQQPAGPAQPPGNPAPSGPQTAQPYPWPAKPPQAPPAPQAPRSTLPLAQRMGVPPSVIQQVPWLDGRTIQILVRALDRQPNETAVIEERPSGDIVRGRLRDGPPPCRYMEIYPAQRSNAFLFLRFCPDALGRWIGEETGG